ncbi:MAG: hypothetical protein ABIW84_01025, partial [Ilumatobacteraceae bacterium]
GPASTEPTTEPTTATTEPTTAATEPITEETIITAPLSDRIDLAEPVFSNPTSINNPLFPISALAQVIQLGSEAGAAVRTEVTLLPETRIIEWNGTQVETLVSQFTAFHDGRVVEVAVDYFAQADDGSVWYFGEDVTNYEEGLIINHDGTWRAGTDGPPGMIMAADPMVGDVYRPENIPGFVFEEVTVKAVDQIVDGPRGPVEGAIMVQELLMDGLLEDKTFAPGYGEFYFAVPVEEEFVDMGIAVPVDALDESVPKELTTIHTSANEVFDAAESQDWTAIGSSVEAMTTAWDSYAGGALPPHLIEQMGAALELLGAGVDEKDPAAVRQGAVDVDYATLDLQLQYSPPAEIDLARMDRWARQVQIDVEAEDAGAVAGDVVVLTAIWDRVIHTVDPAVAASVDEALLGLRRAADAGDLTAAADAATMLQTSVAAAS